MLLGLFHYMTILTELKATYEKLDAYAVELATKAKVSCTKGCSNCCYMLSLATGVEGANIGVFLLNNLDDAEFETMLKDLRAQAIRAVFPGMNNSKYFNRQVKCAFLSDKNLCSIYEVRPAACRYHFVISPAVNCSPLALDTMTRAIDLRQLEAVVWELDVAVAGAPMMAPIPLAVLFGLKTVLKKGGHPELLEMVMKASEGVLTPEEWMRQHGPQVAESTIKGTGKPYRMNLAEK